METTEQKIKELEKQLQELKNEVEAQNQPKFKKGDFCWWSGNNPQFVIILGVCPTYPNDSYSAFLLNQMTSKNKSLNSEFLRLATGYEKQQLIDKLRENGKDWDAEKLEVVDYRWRAGKGELYYWLDSQFEINGYHESFDGDDYIFFDNGNYFKTPELAEAAAEKVKELLLTLKHS